MNLIIKSWITIRETRKRERLYWHRLHTRRLWKLLVALFFSLATTGFFVDLIAWGEMSVLEVLGWAVLCGGFSVAIFLAITKYQKLIPVFIVIYVVCTFVLASQPHRRIFAPLAPAARERMLFDSIGLMASAVIGYVFFNAFVRSEGAEMASLQTELALAQRLQETLVPTLEFATESFEIFAKTIPSEKVGGDLVDGFELSRGVAAYVADVSGHGIQAGTLMGMIKMAVRLYAAQAGDVEPAPLFDALNRALPAVKEPNMFATAACVSAQPDGHVSFATAGHGPVFHYAASTQSISHLRMEQFPLGVFPSTYVSETIVMAAGDILAICTDGILEAENRAGIEFGSAPVEKIVVEYSGERLSRIFAHVVAALHRHCPKPQDDCSLLLLRCRARDFLV